MNLILSTDEVELEEGLLKFVILSNRKELRKDGAGRHNWGSNQDAIR